MASITVRFPFLFYLVFLAILVEMGCFGATNVTVHFINDIGISGVYTRCAPHGSPSFIEHFLQVGEDYRWTPRKPDETHSCVAYWDRLVGIWNGYDPKRDRGHPLVYVNINETGFYLSYDEAYFKHIADW